MFVFGLKTNKCCNLCLQARVYFDRFNLWPTVHPCRVTYTSHVLYLDWLMSAHRSKRLVCSCRRTPSSHRYQFELLSQLALSWPIESHFTLVFWYEKSIHPMRQKSILFEPKGLRCYGVGARVFAGSEQTKLYPGGCARPTSSPNR